MQIILTIFVIIFISINCSSPKNVILKCYKSYIKGDINDFLTYFTEKSQPIIKYLIFSEIIKPEIKNIKPPIILNEKKIKKNISNILIKFNEKNLTIVLKKTLFSWKIDLLETYEKFNFFE